MASSSFQNSDKKNLNSLDLLEDCLKKIYWARKSNLLARIKRSKEKRDNYKSEFALYGDESTDKSVALENHDETINTAIFGSNREGIEEERVPFISISSPSKIPIHATPINKSQYLGLKKTKTHKDDAAAVSLYEFFLTEVSKWLKSNPQGGKDENLRGEFADFLVDKYLSSKLDIFERSEMVANIRKQVSNDIEEFASVGTPPCRNQDILSKKQNLINSSVQQPSQSSSQEELNENSIDDSISMKAPPTMAAKPPKQDKEKQQQEKVKSQYENFVTTKKRVSLHPDVKIMQEYSDLNQDIQSLLSSLQSGNTIKS